MRKLPKIGMIINGVYKAIKIHQYLHRIAMDWFNDFIPSLAHAVDEEVQELL